MTAKLKKSRHSGESRNPVPLEVREGPITPYLASSQRLGRSREDLDVGRHYPIPLRDVSSSWRVGYVGDFCAKIEPGFASGEHNKGGSGIPHLRPMNIDRQGKIDFSVTKFVAPEKEARRLRHGDVLFNNTNSPELVGKTAVVEDPGDWAFSNHMTRLVFHPDVMPRFAAIQLHFLQMRGYFLHGCVKHVNQASVSSKTLARAIPFVVPPFDDQRRIVAELETQLTRLDASVTALKRVQANLKRYRASVLKDACEGRLSESDSAAWVRTTLGEIATSIRNGYSHKPNADVGTRIFRISAVRRMRLDVDDVRYLSGSEADYSEFLVEPQDVLFTRYNGSRDFVGVCAVMPTGVLPTVYPDKLIRVRLPEHVLLPKMLAILASASEARAFLESRIRTTAGQSGISGGDLKAVPLRIPPLAGQQRIVAEVERRLSVIEELDTSATVNLKRANRFREAILSAAFGQSEAS